MTDPTLILASTSATRRALLENAGLRFTSQSPLCDEEYEKQVYKGDPTRGLALHLASRKALSLSPSYPSTFVLGADQTLIFEGQIFSKPKDVSEARQVLQRLRGKAHVLQSAAAIARDSQVIWSEVEEARLHMRDFSDAFIDDYLARAEAGVLSSVGCYQIEKRGIHLFDRIEGDHATILGLPLLGLLRFLRQQGMLLT
jgi:septum formation protein